MGELGIHRRCACCEKTFWCTDGDWVCSAQCSDQLEEEFYKDKMEDLEGHLDNLLCDLVGGYSTEAEFKREWNMAIYEAEMMKDLDPKDIKLLTDKKKQEYKVEEVQ